MTKKFSLAIEIGGALKESFKSVISASKSELKEIQQNANIKIGLSLEENKKKLESQLSGWKSIVGTAISIGAPVKIGADFEYQMKRVKALSNATNDEFKKLEEKARELGATTQYTAAEVGNSMEYLAMAGFKVGEILDATGGVLNLATIGNVDLGTSADIASNILSGFGMKANEINRVVDVMAKTITSSNTSVTELGETMKYVAPVASKAGASIEEVSAMAGLLANIGIKGSEAGTTLRAMFLRLAAPTGGAEKALQKLGVKTKDAQGNLRSMVDILADLDKKFKELPQAMRMEYLKDIFGEEPASGALELISRAGSGELQKYIKDIKDAKGAAENMVGEMNDTVLARWKSVLSAVEGIFLTIYKPLEPILKFTLDVVVDGLRGLTKVLESVSPVLSPVIFGLGSLYIVSKLVSIGMTLSRIASLGFARMLIMSLTPIGQAKIALRLLTGEAVVTSNTLKASSFSLKGFFGAIRGFAISTFNVVRSSFAKIILASRAMGVALLTNPIFWIGAVIAGVGYLIYRNWDKLKYFFKGVWSGIKEGFKPVMDLLENISSIFSPVISSIKSAIASIFSDKDKMVSIGNLIGKSLTFAFAPLIFGAKVINFVINLFRGIGSAITQGFSPLEAISKSVFNAYKAMIISAARFVGTVFVKYISFVKYAFMEVGRSIKTALTSPLRMVEFIIDKIKNVFTFLKNNPISKVFNAGKSVIGGAVSKVVDTGKTIIGGAVGKTKEFIASVFSSKETTREKEKEKHEVVRERIEKRSFAESGGNYPKIDKLVGEFIVNINVPTKEIAKEIEFQLPEVRKKLMALFNDFMAEYERKMRLSHGR